MQTLLSVACRFSAGHSDSAGRCRPGQHGHLFRVAVTARGEYNAQNGVALDLGNLRARVEHRAEELRERNLDRMLYSGIPTLEGIAYWMLEQLRPDIPGLSSVQVTELERDESCLLVVDKT